MKTFIFVCNDDGIETILNLNDLENQYEEDSLIDVLNGEYKKDPVAWVTFKILEPLLERFDAIFRIYRIDCEDDMDDEWWYLNWIKNKEACEQLCITKGKCLFTGKI